LHQSHDSWSGLHGTHTSFWAVFGSGQGLRRAQRSPSPLR